MGQIDAWIKHLYQGVSEWHTPMKSTEEQTFFHIYSIYLCVVFWWQHLKNNKFQTINTSINSINIVLFNKYKHLQVRGRNRPVIDCNTAYNRAAFVWKAMHAIGNTLEDNQPKHALFYQTFLAARTSSDAILEQCQYSSLDLRKLQMERNGIWAKGLFK